MAHLFKAERECKCGYKTIDRSNWSSHKRRCKALPAEQQDERVLAEKDARIEDLQQQLDAKDTQLEAKDTQLEAKDRATAEQLAAKDKQIDELMQLAKKPRTVTNTNTSTTNNKWQVDASINVFGKEATDHISEEVIQALLEDPPNAVAQYIRLKHKRRRENNNVRCPNMKRALYQVATLREDGTKEWEYRAKLDVLEELYDENSTILECKADEDTRVGARFLEFQDRVRLSAGGEDGGRRYKEQLDKIHCVVTSH